MWLSIAMANMLSLPRLTDEQFSWNSHLKALLTGLALRLYSRCATRRARTAHAQCGALFDGRNHDYVIFNAVGGVDGHKVLGKLSEFLAYTL